MVNGSHEASNFRYRVQRTCVMAAKVTAKAVGERMTVEEFTRQFITKARDVSKFGVSIPQSLSIRGSISTSGITEQ